MGFYQITLTVTLEQENAIIELFSDRKWLYQKQGQCNLETQSQSLLAVTDWVSEGVPNANRIIESSAHEQSDCIPLTDSIYKVKTEPAADSYEGDGDYNEDIDMETDCLPAAVVVEHIIDQQSFGNVNAIKTDDPGDKPNAVKTKEDELLHKASVSGKNRKTNLKSCKTKRLRACIRNTKFSGKRLQDSKQKVVVGCNVCDETSSFDLLQSENDHTVSPEGDSLILFTDVPGMSMPKSPNKAVNMSCDTCGFTWKNLKCFKKHVCRKICPYCDKVFPHRRLGNFNRHINSHKRKLENKSVEPSKDNEPLDHSQSACNKASENNTLEQESVENVIQVENILPVTQETLNQHSQVMPNTETESNAAKMKCHVCNHTFRRKKAYDNHACRKVCPFCNKIFIYGGLEDFNKHIKYHEMKTKMTSLKSVNVKQAAYQTKGDKPNIFNTKQDNLNSQIYPVKESHGTQEKSNPDSAKIEFSAKNDSTSFKSSTHTENESLEIQEKVELGSIKTDTDTEQESRNLQCHGCDQIFQSKAFYERHTKSSFCKRICEYCGKVFLRKQISRYPRHIRVHLNVRPFQCSTCGLRFHERSYMLRHQKTVHGDKKRELVCEICGASFTWHAGLRLHKKNKHSNETFQCQHCSRVFKHIDSLQYHAKSKHGNQELPCSKCGKTFRDRKLLRAHEQSHRSRDFKCSHCPSAFKTLGQLKMHTKRHEKAYSHACNQCDKKFYSGAALREHVYTHTGEKPHACSLCDFRCAFQGNLKKHMRVHLKLLS